MKFLDSNLFNSIIVFLGATVAFWIYFKAKRDEKQQAALLIIIEIRQAEKHLNTLIQQTLELILLPSLITTNNWEKYKHLFAKDLDSDNLDIISIFYSNCIHIDKCLAQLSPFGQLNQKNIATQEVISQLAKEAKDEEDFKQKKRNT